MREEKQWKKKTTNPHPRCKDQNRSPRAAHSISPWRLFRTGETNVCWELHKDFEELGENQQDDKIPVCFLTVS